MSKLIEELNKLVKGAASAPETIRGFKPISALPGGQTKAQQSTTQPQKESIPKIAMSRVGGIREAKERIERARLKAEEAKRKEAEEKTRKIEERLETKRKWEELSKQRIAGIEPTMLFPKEESTKKELESILERLSSNAATQGTNVLRELYAIEAKFEEEHYDITAEQIEMLAGNCSVPVPDVSFVAKRVAKTALREIFENEGEYSYLWKKSEEKDKRSKGRTEILKDVLGISAIRNRLKYRDENDEESPIAGLKWREAKEIFPTLISSLKGIRSTVALASGRVLSSDEGLELLVNGIRAGRFYGKKEEAMLAYDWITEMAVLDEAKVINWRKQTPIQRDEDPAEHANWMKSRHAAAEVLEEIAIKATKAIALYVAPEIEWEEGNYFAARGREFLEQNKERFVERIVNAKPEKYYLERLAGIEKEIEEGDEISFDSMWEVIKMMDCPFRSVAPKADEISEKYFIKTIKRILEDGNLCIEYASDENKRKEIRIKTETLVELLIEMCRPKPQGGLEQEKASWEVVCVYGLEDRKRHVAGSVATEQDMDYLVANKERIVENIVRRRSREDYTSKLEKAIENLEAGKDVIDNIKAVRELMGCVFTDVAEKAEEYSAEYIFPYIEEHFRKGAFYKNKADAKTLIEIVTDLATAKEEGGIEQEKKAWKFLRDNILVFRFPPGFIKEELMTDEWREYILANIDEFVEYVSNLDVQTIRRINAIETEIREGNPSSARELYSLCSDSNRITAQRATYVFNSHAIALLAKRLTPETYDLLLDASLLQQSNPAILGQLDIRAKATKIIYEAFARQGVPEGALMDEERAKWFRENKAQYFPAASSHK